MFENINSGTSPDVDILHPTRNRQSFSPLIHLFSRPEILTDADDLLGWPASFFSRSSVVIGRGS